MTFHDSKTKTNRDILQAWAATLGSSLCSILELVEDWAVMFSEASFCSSCQELICSADFSLRAIRRLESDLGLIRRKIKECLRSHFEIITNSKDTEISVQEILTALFIKPEPTNYDESEPGPFNVETAQPHFFCSTEILDTGFPNTTSDSDGGCASTEKKRAESPFPVYQIYEISNQLEEGEGVDGHLENPRWEINYDLT